MEKGTLKGISITSYLGSAWFVGCGFYKLFVYKNDSSTSLTTTTASAVNAYVGGDAYNYIINSNRATAYFVLALILIVIASTCTIVSNMNTTKEAKTIQK